MSIPVFIKYSMKKQKQKETMNFHRLFTVLGYIFLFLLCHTLTAYIFLYVYPNLVENCEKNALMEYSESNEPSDFSSSSLSDYVMSKWICRPIKYKDYSNGMQFNTMPSKNSSENTNRLSKNSSENTNRPIKNPPENTNRQLLNRFKCKCYNSSESDIKDGSETFDSNYRTTHKCICNETEQMDDFKVRNGTENQKDKLLSTKGLSQSNDFYFDKTGIVNEGHYIQVSANGTETINEQQANQLFRTRECNCSDIQKNVDDMLNGSANLSEKINNEFLNNNQCICPEIPEIVADSSASEITTRNQNDDSESVTERETFDSENVHFDKIEAEYEKPFFKNDECVCPNLTRKSDGNYNETKHTVHNTELDVDDECKCLEMLEINNFDIKEADYATVKIDVVSSESEGCECTEIPQILDIFLNASKFRNKKSGVKTENGECICSENEETDAHISYITANESKNHTTKNRNIEKSHTVDNFSVTETEKADKKQSLKREKCLCPVTLKTTDNSTKVGESHETHEIKFMEDGECECSDIFSPENYDINTTISATSEVNNHFLQLQKCECPEMSKSMGNGSVIKSHTLGVKTIDGECVCPDTNSMEKIDSDRSGIVEESETVSSDKDLFRKEKN